MSKLHGTEEKRSKQPKTDDSHLSIAEQKARAKQELLEAAKAVGTNLVVDDVVTQQQMRMTMVASLKREKSHMQKEKPS